MTYPSITPIEPGRDGWSLLYPDETSRLLFLCGLRVEANVVQKTRTTSAWGVPSRNIIKHGVKTAVWDGRAVKPSLAGVQGALRSLMRLRGKPAVKAVLHRYGATTAVDLDKRWYGCVYVAATEFIRETAR